MSSTNLVLDDDVSFRDAKPYRALIIGVRTIAGDECDEVFSVDLLTPALEIGPTAVVLGRPGIPFQPKPTQSIVDRLNRLVRVALVVCVFNSENELPSVALGEEPIEERGTGAADMQVTGRGRGESSANLATK